MFKFVELCDKKLNHIILLQYTNYNKLVSNSSFSRVKHEISYLRVKKKLLNCRTKLKKFNEYLVDLACYCAWISSIALVGASGASESICHQHF